MASAQPAQPVLKPTFAKVAASPYVPSHPNQNTSAPNSTSNDLTSKDLSKAHSITDVAVNSKGQNAGDASDRPPVIITKRSPLDTKPVNATGSMACATTAGEARPAETLTKAPPTDDNSTQVSSSDGSAKLPNFDKQSVASGATFGLDEKASLRPDDSISTKAIEEEDVFSGPSTGAPSSRVGSDTDARAFSEQLHQIAVMAPRGGVPPITVMRANIAFGEIPMNVAAAQPQMLPSIGAVPAMQQTTAAPTPDEKLLEALESVRDRVYVLKIEQDILDLLKNEKDTQLSLPETNAFYRMLAHKLADYYGLEHAVQNSSTGAAVMITKTPCAKIPVPLSGISHPSTQASTPPPVQPARKIMRRGDEVSGTSTSVNSEGQSKAGSEDGSDQGRGTPNGSKSKAALTREQREAKYAEARLRIFGHIEESETTEGSKECGENDVSRTSSAAGKKKTKKQRNESNDDFEPRSQFPGYHPNTYTQNGYPAETAMFYPQFPGMMTSPPQYGIPQNASPPPVMYANGYQQVDAQGQYAYMQQQQPYSMPQHGMSIPSYGQPPPANYDLSAQFQQGMQFQTTPASAPVQIPRVSAPKASSPSFPPQYQLQPQQMASQPQMMQYDGNYQYSPSGFVPMYPPERPMSSPGQTPEYLYGQLPSGAYGNGRQPKHQHPMPGSYKGPTFNPQTQAFVPGVRGGGGQIMPIGSPNASMYNGYAPIPTHLQAMQGIQARSTPSTSNPSAYSSPRNQAVSMATQSNNTSNPIPLMSFGSNSYSAPSSAPPTSIHNHGGNSSNPGNLPPQPPPSQHQHQPQQLTHPLPQPPNLASSIAKWGTPSHLPPKPPAPVDMNPQKFIEINRGLPPHTQIPGLPRSAFVPGNNVSNGSAGTNGTQPPGK